MLKKSFVLLTFILAGCNAQITPANNKSDNGCVYDQIDTGTYTKFVVFIEDLEYWNSEKNVGKGHFWSGIIIGLRTILTLASCLRNYNTDRLIVIAGSPNVNKKTSSRQIVHIRRAVLHPLYEEKYELNPNDKTPPAHDIGLIYLREKLVEYPGRVEVYTDFHCFSHKPDTICTLIGWGRPERIISLTDVVVYEQGICHDMFHPVENTFCAGVANGKTEDARLAGLGAPLFCKGILTALRYWSMGSATYYVDTCKYLDWIKVNTLEYIDYRSSSRRELDDNFHCKMLSIMYVLALPSVQYLLGRPAFFI